LTKQSWCDQFGLHCRIFTNQIIEGFDPVSHAVVVRSGGHRRPQCVSGSNPGIILKESCKGILSIPQGDELVRIGVVVLGKTHPDVIVIVQPIDVETL
jgi:hypothetical protein